MLGIGEKARGSAGGSRGRRRLLSSCAIVAILAAGAAPSPARAQAFNAVNNTPTQTNASVSNDGATGTSVFVSGAQAVIDWEPNSTALAANGGTGAIDFLPAGHTVTFDSGYGFTVLNRVNGANADLTRPISLDGTVISRVNGEQGGNVWFYSPAGIIAGEDSVFNVGGLLLTASAVNMTGGLYGNGPLNGPGGAQAGQITLSSPSGSQAAIVISAGAQINAQIADGSYVALVAPRVNQGGTINVNGGAAYVAAEGASIGFSTDGGLVSAAVTTGTRVGITAGDNVTLTHSGTTTGPASGGANDPHNIFFVILPKNDAVTMLLTGTIGYQAAFNASVQNGAIVLGAGTTVDNISVPETSYSGIPSATFNGNIDIAGGSFTSNVTGFYTGNGNVSSRLSNLNFTKDLTIRPSYGSGAIGDTMLTASNGHNLTIDGNLSLFVMNGRTAQAAANAGSVLRVNGSTLISASQFGAAETGYGPYVPATAGQGATALLTANGGNVILAGILDLEAEGQGGYGPNLGGGAGIGGTATLSALAGGSVTVTGAATIDARGLGGDSSIGDGGAGTGGAASVVADGGTVAFDGGAQLLALGNGGATQAGTAGAGTGGTAALSARAGGSAVSNGAGLINILANGTGGASADATGGAGTGGTASLTADAASITLAGETEVDADGVGGESMDGNATGPGGHGGTSLVSATAGGAILVPGMNVAARGQDHDGNGGTGGTVTLTADRSTIEADPFLNLFTVNAGSGGTGGSVTVAATGSGGVSVGGLLQIISDTAQITHASPTRDTIAADSIQAFVATSFTAAAPSAITAADDIEIDAGSFITAGKLTAGDPITLTAGTNATLGSLNAERLTIGAGGAINIAAATVTGTADLNAGGDILAGGLGIIEPVTAVGNNVTLVSVDPLHVASATARAGNLTISGAALQLDGATAKNGIDINVNGLASLSGDISAPTIDVSSIDIAIDPAARIGIATDAITLTNNGNREGATQVGDDNSDATWVLSNDEFGRLSAHTITINAPQAEDIYSLRIGQLDVIGSAGADTGSRRQNLTGSDLVLNTTGSALVDGAVSLTNAGTNDRLTIDAADRLDVITPTGSITLSGQKGALGGTLDLAADTIFVGLRQAATDLAALTTIGARNARLATNDGAVNSAGFIQTDGLVLTGNTGIYIQNTGTAAGPDTRAGFTVGDGGVTIGTTGRTKTEVIINGRQASTTAPGDFVTGAALIPLLHLTESAIENGLARGSTANSCLLDGTPCGVVRVTVPDVPPVQDVINTSLDPSAQLAFLVQLPLIELSDVVSVGLEPLIDDPVTGAGNEDMWLGSSDLDDGRKKDKAHGTAN